MRKAVLELPFEIITEILSWLPVESLVRFKCVCRQWYSLLVDYKFIAKHMLRASPVKLSYQIVWEPTNKNNVCLRLDENFSLIKNVAGLFLERSLLTAQVLRIRNFATRQVLYLPDAHNSLHRASMVFDSSTGECKVASFCDNQDFNNHGEVVIVVPSIGKDDGWRPLKPPNQIGKLSQGAKYYFAANYGEEAAHVVEIINDGDDMKLQVQSFDIWSEYFTITTLPRTAFTDLKSVKVFRWYPYVAVADIIGESLKVMVLQDFKEHRWSQITVPLKFLKDDPVLKDQIKPRLAYRCRELLYFTNVVRNNILEYDMKREMIKAIIVRIESRKRETSHKPSLVTLKGMKTE